MPLWSSFLLDADTALRAYSRENCLARFSRQPWSLPKFVSQLKKGCLNQLVAASPYVANCPAPPSLARSSPRASRIVANILQGHAEPLVETVAWVGQIAIVTVRTPCCCGDTTSKQHKSCQIVVAQMPSEATRPPSEKASDYRPYFLATKLRVVRAATEDGLTDRRN